LPTKSDELRAQLGLGPIRPSLGKDWLAPEIASRAAGEPLAPGAPLFPTVDDVGAAALLATLMPTTTTTTTSTPTPTPITYDQFSTVDLRVGVVRTCDRVPKKDKLLKLAVDLGEGELRTIVAGLALSFQPEQLVGRTVVVVANLAPRDFGKGLLSHGMLLAAGPSEALTLATVEGDVPPGTKVK
jgi:methionyl-tRNA synthetase